MGKPILTLTGLLILAWCTMTVTHESGHIIGGVCCGAHLVNADLWPWHLPYSLFEPDPQPLVTLWCGPGLGVIMPLAMAFVLRTNAAWLVASFCLAANGLYLATAWISGDPHLDTARLLQHGASPAGIVLYCLVTISSGWYGLSTTIRRVLSETRSPAVSDDASVSSVPDA